MADMQLATASRISKWDSQFFTEYVRDTRYRPYMGRASRNAMMPIVVKYELASGGKTVNIPLITRLKGGGVQGTTRLVGNEEALGNFNKSITVNWNRNGVSIPKPEESWTEIDLREAARMQLRTWASEVLRDDITCALLAFDGTSFLGGKGADDTSVATRTPLQAYLNYSEGVKDAWLAANADRFLFGAAVSNNSANDHSASLLNVDTTNDRLTSALVSLAKIRAQQADPRLRPFKTDDAEGREWFVMFVSSLGMNQLKQDTAMVQANREARPRDVAANPIFQSGDLIWDGVIIREVPEIPVIPGVGNGGSDVAPAFLCGAQAVGLAWGQEPATRIKKEDDYGFVYGVAIEECRAASKMTFSSGLTGQTVQHGMLTVWHSAPALA